MLEVICNDQFCKFCCGQVKAESRFQCERNCGNSAEEENRPEEMDQCNHKQFIECDAVVMGGDKDLSDCRLN